MSNQFHYYLNNGVSDSSASGPGHSIKETFMCRWDGECGLYCDVLFVGSNLSAHLREAHGIQGSDKSPACCRWKSCNRQFNKESLARHVEEIHLGIVYKCGCGNAYSRKDTLNRHQKKCSGQR